MADTNTLLTALEQQEQHLIDTAIQWSNVNSGSFNLDGLAKMAELAKAHFASLGATVTEHETQPMQQINSDGDITHTPLGNVITFEKRPDAPFKILFTGHLDTVFPKDHHFQQAQYLNDGVINGPGITDMKGGILVIKAALEAFEKSDYADQVGWTVLLNPDEEIGSPGSRPFLEAAAKTHDVGFVYEPSAKDDGTLAGQRKGSGNFSIVVHGKAAHAGRAFEQGRNAIGALATAMVQLSQLNGKQEGVTLNLGRIEGGGPLNVVADLAIAHFNVRTQQPEDQVWLQQHFDTIINTLNQQDGIRAELHGAFTRPPKPLTPKLEKLFNLVKNTGAELGLPIAWEATGGVCDGNNLTAAGLPTVDTLGVRGGKIHSDQEYIILESLVERAKLSTLLLIRLAQQHQEWRKSA